MNPYISAYKKNASARQTEKRRSFFSSGALAIFFLLGLSFLLVYKHTLGQYMLIEVQELKTSYDYLVTEQSVLLGEKQACLSRERIISYARERLSLELPSPDRIHWIKAEAVRPVHN
jgi:hypothetical protein